jgi:adenosylmethionine-8-amino-7-oxononanoate aminotransferase
MPTISHGTGVWLYDTTGKKYLDGCSGATAANIGHAIPEVLEASCYCCEFSETFPACNLHCANDVERAILETNGTCASVILEPVVGASGGAVAPMLAGSLSTPMNESHVDQFLNAFSEALSETTQPTGEVRT